MFNTFLGATAGHIHERHHAMLLKIFHNLIYCSYLLYCHKFSPRVTVVSVPACHQLLILTDKILYGAPLPKVLNVQRHLLSLTDRPLH